MNRLNFHLTYLLLTNALTKLLLVLMLSIVVLPSFAQDKESLRDRKAKLLKQIDETNQLLKETQKTKAASISELRAIQSKIKARESLINNINQQKKALQRQIYQTQIEIKSLQKDLEHYREEYAQLAYYTYKSSLGNTPMLFLLSAKSFNDSYKRFSYLKRYHSYRKIQMNQIKETLVKLDDKETVLQSSKDSVQVLINEQVAQKNMIQKDYDKQNLLVSQLGKNEKKLKRDINKKKKTTKELDAAIAAIIQREIETARAASNNTENTTVSTSKSILAKTPEAIKLSNSFASNKGKLPWPVDRGIVSETFGEHTHPVLRGIKIKNNGVDIKTYKNAKVRAVFEGEVIFVRFVPGSNYTVIIRHGDYFTVYSNLQSANVQPKQKVATKQPIGIASTEDGNSAVHLEIWKDKVKMNPSSWIK